MNTLIVYATRYGCSESCAEIISEKLEGEVTIHNLKEGQALDLSHIFKK